MHASIRLVCAALIAAFGVAACAGGSTPASGMGLPQQLAPERHTHNSSYIHHIVVVIQENRSFDDFFATFPGADGTTQGRMELPSGGHVRVRLQKVGLSEKCDFGHSYNNFVKDYNGGRMDGFGFEPGGKNLCPGPQGKAVYQYVDPSQLAPDWAIAKQYVLADQMFQTQGSGSFTAHQDLIAGSTIIDQPHDTQSLVDFPSNMPWGCDAPKLPLLTRTSLLVVDGPKLRNEYHKGPFPCLTYPTLRDLLDAKSVSWKYYSPPEPKGVGALWNGFDAIKAVREGPEWTTNIAHTNVFFSDVTNGTLAAVSWIVPEQPNSDHPGGDHDAGPSWVAAVVNAVGQSAYWKTTAIVVVWDDWGGFYDHVRPPFIDRWGGLGFRVPMLVVSPYAREAISGRPGYISHSRYEFGSILRFIENVWGLRRLGTTDSRAGSIGDCFDFTQTPRKFSVIAAKYSKSYFLHQAPSYEPVDTE